MVLAFVLVSCELGAEKAVIDELKTFDAVKEAIGTFGVYDILVKLEADSDHKLNDTITKKIRKMNKVGTTTTLMVIQEQE
ncbi:MAG: AsnC family transcriptional regulator [Nitrosopumilales archaeon]|nr:MAG: AsnC family transcriptional regulator [Nitrosopumilales archaeon]